MKRRDRPHGEQLSLGAVGAAPCPWAWCPVLPRSPVPLLHRDGGANLQVQQLDPSPGPPPHPSNSIPICSSEVKRRKTSERPLTGSVEAEMRQIGGGGEATSSSQSRKAVIWRLGRTPVSSLSRDVRCQSATDRQHGVCNRSQRGTAVRTELRRGGAVLAAGCRHLQPRSAKV